jgi:alpha,alpha-trehalose phosphorylase
VATFGGVWQALATGFLGLRPTAGALGLDPCLPSAWTTVAMRLRYHGRRLRIRTGHDHLEVTPDGPLRLELPGLPAATAGPPGARWRRVGSAWKQEPA